MMTSHDDWWAGLSGDERMLAIETVRLDQPLDIPGAEQLDADHAEFVRRTPEYLERFAGAEQIARVDETGIGPGILPESHRDTHPL